MRCPQVLKVGEMLSKSFHISGGGGLDSRRIVLIGNGKMAIDCLTIMREHPNLNVLFVITDPLIQSVGSSLKDYCAQQNINCLESENVNAPEIVNKLVETEPEIIFNINSYKIIKEKILALPNVRIVNFHNGPLPTYGGVNACSWAILNGEKIHGVTWHYVDQGIDTGDIIAQRFFDISPNETAIRLIMKCIREGTALFREILPDLINGTIQARTQDSTQASYYSLKDIPNGGWIDFRWTFEHLDRFIRGLTFHPMSNNFVIPKTKYNSRELYIQKIIKVGDSVNSSNSGAITALTEDQINVQVDDAIIGIKNVLDDERRERTIKSLVETYGIKVGGIMGE